MVAALWRDFERGANERVPIVFATDEALWLSRTGHTFRQFYTDPRVQLQVQLEGPAWFADAVVQDQRLGPPAEAWTVTPRFWMDEPEFFGCEVVIQEDSFAWSRPLAGSKADLVGRLADLDPAQRARRCLEWARPCRQQQQGGSTQLTCGELKPKWLGEDRPPPAPKHLACCALHAGGGPLGCGHSARITGP